MTLPIITIEPVASANVLEAPGVPAIATVPFTAFGEDPTVRVLGDYALDVFGGDELGVGG